MTHKTQLLQQNSVLTSKIRKVYFIILGKIRHKKSSKRKFEAFLYSERDLNPHEHCCSLDFKSSVSTNFTIRALTFYDTYKLINISSN